MNRIPEKRLHLFSHYLADPSLTRATGNESSWMLRVKLLNQALFKIVFASNEVEPTTVISLSGQFKCLFSPRRSFLFFLLRG